MPAALHQSHLVCSPLRRRAVVSTACVLLVVATAVINALASASPFQPVITVTPGSDADTRVDVEFYQGEAYLYRHVRMLGNPKRLPVRLNGTRMVGEDWLWQKGTAEIKGNLQPSFLMVGFACFKEKDTWRCGCQAESCDRPRWQIWGSSLKPVAPVLPSEAEAKTLPAADRMVLSGRYRFSAPSGKAAEWTVDRYRLRSDTFDLPLEEKAIFTATGREATFDLAGEATTDTRYKITAKTGGLSDSFTVQAFPAAQTAAFSYNSAGNYAVLYLVAAPPVIDEDTRLIQVFHDSVRNANYAISHWSEWAKKHNYLVIAPSFPYWDWPVDDYGEGNVFNKPDGEGTMNPRWNWTFTIADDAARKVIEEFGLQHQEYDIFGHSGGGRFTHRFLLFLPEAPIRYAFPANPGRWTLPTFTARFPWGMAHPFLTFTESDLLDYTNRKMIIVRGLDDIYRDSGLDVTPQGEAQGPHRVARAQRAFDLAKAFNPEAKWELLDVPDCGHNESCLVPAVQRYLETHDHRQE